MGSGHNEDIKSTLRDTAKAQRARLVGGDRAEAARAAVVIPSIATFPTTAATSSPLFWPIRDEIDSSRCCCR